MKADHVFCVEPTLRKSGTIPLLPMLSWHAQGQLYLNIYSTLLHIAQLYINFSKPFSFVSKSYVYKKENTKFNAVVFMLQEFL